MVLSLFAGLRPHELESIHWQDVLQTMVVFGPKSKEFRIAPVTANLLAWLERPAQAHGPVVTKSARRKVKALLLTPKVPLHALRTTCLVCWLALHGPQQTALHAGISKVPTPEHSHYAVSRAEAECFFGLTPD